MENLQEHDNSHNSHGSDNSMELSKNSQDDSLLKTRIIIPAWELVTNVSVLKKFNFFPSLLATIYLGCIVLYQIAFTYVYIFHLKDQFFAFVIEFVHKSYFLEVVIVVAIGVILYILITPIAEAGLISLIEKKMNDKAGFYGVSYGISRGILNFLPIFEFTNTMLPFKLVSIITFYILLLRIFTTDYFSPITICMFFYLIFAFVINILFSYTKFFIIFENKRVFESMSLSVKMALDNLHITFHLYFTLLLVYIRTIVTAVIFIFFPFIVSALFTYFTIAILQIISVAILGVIFLAFLIIISHLNSVLEIFVEAIWHNAYIDNKKSFPAVEESHH